MTNEATFLASQQPCHPLHKRIKHVWSKATGDQYIIIN